MPPRRSATDPAAAGAHPAPPPHPFERLTPQAVLDALDGCGLRGDGRLLQLNSYENRVFQVMLEDGGAVVAKFYRPGRWTDDQIVEEHGFAAELAAAEVPVVAPLPLQGAAGAGTLATVDIGGQPLRVAAYPRCAGQAPELDDPGTLRWLGRFIARLHGVGERRPFVHRRRLDAATLGQAPLQQLLAADAVPHAQRPAWRDAAERALAAAAAALAACPADELRLHGDCHPGNILWRTPDEGGSGPHIVDLDDALTGPAVQDLWMWLSGEREAQRAQLAQVLRGYRQIRRFDLRELSLIEALRTLRMLHHSAWLAARWDDPAFPVAFPWFGSAAYWGQQTVELREQLAAMAEPPLDLDWLD